MRSSAPPHTSPVAVPCVPAFFSEAADFFADYADGVPPRQGGGRALRRASPKRAPRERGPDSRDARGARRGARLHAHPARLRQRLESGDCHRVSRCRLRRDAATPRSPRSHRQRGSVLFPMAAEIIPESAPTTSPGEFRHVEHTDAGPHAHADFLDLAQRLEREMSRTGS